VPLTTLRIGRDVADADGGWSALLGIASGGALLVRPDQHVAWRAARSAADPRAALDAAFAGMLGV
jgi:2,4-dichlorophenol 6-monooxygenase